MAQTVVITLTTAGADTGPFDLYSNVDGYAVPFESSVAKGDLEAGYISFLVPDAATTIRVQSDNPLCDNFIDLLLSGTTTTTSTASPTTTTTTTPTPTTTTTTTSPPEFGILPLFGMNITGIAADSGTIPAFSYPANSGTSQFLTMVSGYSAGTTFTVGLSGTKSPAGDKTIKFYVNSVVEDCAVISLDGINDYLLTVTPAILISDNVTIRIENTPTC